MDNIKVPLMDHWVEHNRSHEASYTEWAQRTKEMGEEAAADLIMQAVDKMKEADGLLLGALDSLR
jgi:hypothetical protein